MLLVASTSSDKLTHGIDLRFATTLCLVHQLQRTIGKHQLVAHSGNLLTQSLMEPRGDLCKRVDPYFAGIDNWRWKSARSPPPVSQQAQTFRGAPAKSLSCISESDRILCLDTNSA